MPSRLIAWLEAQPQGRRRLYSGLIALSLITLPFYAAGLALSLLAVGPPAPPVALATAAPSPSASATIGLHVLPTVAPPPTWTPDLQPDEPDEPAATLDPGLPTVDPALASPAASPLPSATEAGPTTAPTAPPTALPPTAEPTALPSAEPTALPTAEPTAAIEPTGEPPTPIGGFTPQPAGHDAGRGAGVGR